MVFPLPLRSELRETKTIITKPKRCGIITMRGHWHGWREFAIVVCSVYCGLPPETAPKSRAICSVSRYCWNLTARPSRIVQM
jgi:hypothetical protein